MPKAIYLIFILFATLFQPGNIIAQEYVVGGDFDYAPFTFIDKAGNPRGLEIDVLKAISASSDLQLSFQLSRWDSALSYIQSGKTDIIAGIIFSEEREEFLDFTIPIHTEYYSIFIHKDLPFNGLSNLHDYRPVVLEEDISIDKYLKPMGLFKNYVLAQSLPEALSVIEMGLADYVLAPNLLGLNEIENNNYQNIEVVGPSIIPSIYCIAVKKGNTQLLNILNEGISELKRNGQLAEIQEKWKVYALDDAKYKRIANIIGIVFIIAVVLLILVFLWVRLLRLQIKNATESIHHKNQELQKAIRMLKEQESQLRELNSTKDKLFSIIAHDLRSPFNAIIGLSELLIGKTKDLEVAKIEKYMGIIHSTAKNTLTLLDNLLTWAKSQTGSSIYQPEKTNLPAIISEIAAEAKSIAKIKNVTVNHIQSDDFKVYADENMLKTILRNLISNAIKYTHPNGEIAISAEQNQNNIEITVSDNGVGMDEETQNKLFQIDTNITNTGTADEKGSGLGLIICKEFVEKHGGEIWIESEPGKGSSFTFSLPVT